MSPLKLFLVGVPFAVAAGILTACCICFPLATLLSASLVVGVFLAGYYVFLKMVDANIIWARVEQGWRRIILKWGKYYRTVGPGLHMVGIPGIHTLYKRTMTFFKSVTDKNGKPQAEPHNDKDIGSFKTTRYPYAFPFKDEEDSHALHLSGILAGHGVVEDYEKAFFDISDWYAEMNTKILSCNRDLLATISYDDDIVGRDMPGEQRQLTYSARLWKALNDMPNGNPSVIDRLRAEVGIRIESVELRSVDPPEGWRDTTLAPYKAEREADAAEAVATAESRKAAGPIDIAVGKWVESQREYDEAPDGKKTFAETVSATRKRLRDSGEYQEHKALLADQINRSRRTVQERKVDFTSGGKALAGGSIAEIAGTITAAIVGAVAGKNIKDDADQSGNPAGGQGNQGQQGGKNPKDMTPEELEEFYQNWRKGKKP